MRRRAWRSVASWAGIAALLCQVLLPFGAAWLASAASADASLQAPPAAHYHDPNLANVLGRDWLTGHSHAGDPPAGRVRLDHGYLTPCAAVNPPAEPALIVRWAFYRFDRAALLLPAADGFSRPFPRAPPPAA